MFILQWFYMLMLGVNVLLLHLNEAMIREEKLFLSAQKDMSIENPDTEDLI